MFFVTPFTKKLTRASRRRILFVPVVFVPHSKFRQRSLSSLVVVGGLLSLAVAGIVSAKPYGLTRRENAGPFLNGALPEIAPSISGNWTAVIAFTNLLFT